MIDGTYKVDTTQQVVIDLELFEVGLNDVSV